VNIVGVTTVNATTGWKIAAVIIGLGVLALLWLFVGVSGGTDGWKFWKLAEGADGKTSTSKFQWLVWLIAILFAYTVLWTLRASTGDYGAITEIPANLLTVLGLSTVTAAAAKGITVGYLQSGRVSKEPSDGNAAGGNKGGILADDSGFPELAKIQMTGFTFISVGIFLATLFHQIHTNPAQVDLPNIDSSLLVIMGLSQGGYVAKKLVSVATPALYAPPDPSPAAAGTNVTIRGASLGAAQGASQLLLDGFPIAVGNWTDSAITFTVPQAHPSGSAWTANQTVKLVVDLGGGRQSNEVLLAI
jgi:hypothetical protein